MEIAQSVVLYLFLAVLTGIGVWDMRKKMISPLLLYCLLAVTAVSILLEVLRDTITMVPLIGAVLAGLITGLVFFAMYKATKGIGLGDVKLMVVVGLFFGPLGIVTIVFIAMVLAALVGIFLVIKDRKNLKMELPFAPFVALAALIRQGLILVQTL